MPTIEFDDRTLFFRDSGGTGPAVLLFHAFPLDSRMWQGLIDAWPGPHRIIAPDVSGFGASSIPTDRSSYSVDRWADEGLAILQSLGIREAVVGGCSMGGYVSLAFLRRHPAAARGLILIDTRADVDSPEGLAIREEQQREVRERGTAELRERLLLKLLSEKNLAGGDVVSFVRQLLDQKPDGIVGALEAMKKRPDSTTQLEGIRIPTLVVVGAEDILTPPAISEEMARKIPGAGLATLPRAGHLANLEEPEAFQGALRSFLQGLDS